MSSRATGCLLRPSGSVVELRGGVGRCKIVKLRGWVKSCQVAKLWGRVGRLNGKTALYSKKARQVVVKLEGYRMVKLHSNQEAEYAKWSSGRATEWPSGLSSRAIGCLVRPSGSAVELRGRVGRCQTIKSRGWARSCQVAKLGGWVGRLNRKTNLHSKKVIEQVVLPRKKQGYRAGREGYQVGWAARQEVGLLGWDARLSSRGDC